MLRINTPSLREFCFGFLGHGWNWRISPNGGAAEAASLQEVYPQGQRTSGGHQSRQKNYKGWYSFYAFLSSFSYWIFDVDVTLLRSRVRSMEPGSGKMPRQPAYSRGCGIVRAGAAPAVYNNAKKKSRVSKETPKVSSPNGRMAEVGGHMERGFLPQTPQCYAALLHFFLPGVICSATLCSDTVTTSPTPKSRHFPLAQQTSHAHTNTHHPNYTIKNS